MRVLSRFVNALFSLFVALSLSLSVASSPASAQTAEGLVGWSSSHTTEKFASADLACRSQWQYYRGVLSRYIGAFPFVGNPNKAGCSWTTYQFLCPEETGGGISACWTILPSWVELECQSGYVPTLGNLCLKDPVPERPCNCNNGSSVNPQTPNPIVLSTGAKVLKARDYSGGGGDFVIGRSYRSIPVGRSTSFQTTPRGLAGGWTFDFAYELQLAAFSGSPSSPNASLALVAPDGTAYDFMMQSGGTMVPDTTTGAFYAPTDLKVEYVGTLPSDLSTLQSASTQWRVTDGDDRVWTFQTFNRPNTTSSYVVGRPSSRVTREGYRWDLAYRADDSLQTITDSFGKQAIFNWSTFYMSTLASPPVGFLPWPEVVSSVSLPDGTSLRYSYDPPPATAAPSSGFVQRLTKVERVNASAAVIDSTTYSYGDSRFASHITGVTDFTGAQVASYSYDAGGRGISSALANGNGNYAVTPTDTATERVRTVTNPLGKVADYHFQKFGGGMQDVRLTSVVGQASVNTPAASSAITYDSNNFIATTTDEEGRVTSYTRDSRGRPTTIVEAYGTPQARTTTVTWHATFNVPTRTVRPGLQVDYTYGSTGQLLTRTQTDTTSQSVPYATNGQTRGSTYTWGTGGRLASINGPKAIDAQGKDDTLTFGYDASGNLVTSTNGLGQVTAFANYDANGRPGTMTDANGIVSAFTYDALGRANTVTVRHPTSSPLNAVTSFDYDIHDRVIGVTSPATDKLFIDYDTAGRVTAIRAASGERIDYQTDPNGNVTGETVKRANATVARSVTRSFDELGRLLTEALGPGRTTTYAYDKVDNLKQVTSARNLVTQAAFDPLNRLVSTVAPDTGTTATGYNALDNVTSHTDAISVQTSYVRDGFGDAIQEVSPDRGTSTYYYNAGGELTAVIDGRGQRIDYTRDILGRITQKVPASRPASEIISYAWDSAGLAGSYGVGRPSSVTDATGTTSFAYDHRGNPVTKRQTVGSGSADLAYAYDLADRVTQITYPSGRLVAYGYDTKGRVVQVNTKASVSVPSWTALASAMTYEPWGSLLTATMGNGLKLAQVWTDGRLTSKRLYNSSTSASLSYLGYAYDGNDNIGAITDQLTAANSIYYGYDPNDRLTLTSLVTATTPGAETYSYTTGTNRLASFIDSTGTRSITYDARGNTLTEARPGSVSVSTGYDGYGRLLSYARTGSPAQANVYNGLDDRVKVTSGSTTRAYVYDSDGRMLGEYATSAADPVVETIWLSPTVTNDNAPFGGDDGVSGYAPLAIAGGIGASATLYWVHGNHLGVPTVITNTSGATATPTGYTAVGFPGQTRTLADLYYNRYRDYDTTTGRYIQGDPIGLGGGDNLYLYAEGNPLRFTDPMGLRTAESIAAEKALRLALPSILLETAAKPSRKIPVIGEALLIGDAIGTAVAVIEFLYEHNCKDGRCPPCRPYPAGKIGYIGPHTDHDHFPVGRPHLNLFIVNQDKTTCKCYWNKANPSAISPPPQPNWVNLNFGFPPLQP